MPLLENLVAARSGWGIATARCHQGLEDLVW